ncbi:hypothetical protein HAV15_003304 [Penicillium sp. str. |nr:hypothetical protein HAV15_003304 [Penicillium sp. str. \
MTSTPQPPDYYEVLQVAQNAVTEAIRSSYKRLALARHPDKNTAKNAVAEFQLLQEAYSTLIDPNTRKVYDIKYEAFISTSRAQYSTGQQSRKTPDKNEEQISLQELQSKLRQCANNLRELEVRQKEARVGLMKLRTEIASLDNEIRSMEHDKLAGQSIWNYVASFLPGRVSRLEQQRQEQDRSYRGKIATRRIRETEKSRKLTAIQSYETIIVTYRRQALSIERTPQTNSLQS